MPILATAKNHMLENIIENTKVLGFGTGSLDNVKRGTFGVSTNGRKTLTSAVELDITVSGPAQSIDKIYLVDFPNGNPTNHSIIATVDIATQTFDYSGILTIVANSTYFELTDV